jgi:hypothetical protein
MTDDTDTNDEEPNVDIDELPDEGGVSVVLI